MLLAHAHDSPARKSTTEPFRLPRALAQQGMEQPAGFLAAQKTWPIAELSRTVWTRYASR
jgi:hypothetical protein